MPSPTLILLLTLLALCAVPAVAAEFAPTDWAPKQGPLTTRWAKDVSPTNAHPEYPRPQMARRDWRSLNGVWSVVVTNGEEKAAAQPILVPFPIESALSGVMKAATRARYTRTFEVPAAWAGQKILLHFEAVDWEAAVRVNGKALGTHRGGYDPFTFDITDALSGSGPQTLEVDVFDPSDAGDQPRGKQVEKPEGIWYTPSTGIWASVWLEPVPQGYIDDIVTTPDVDAGALRLSVTPGGETESLTVRAAAYDGSRKVGEVTGAPGEELRIPVPNAKLWSPDTPHLYRLKVSLMRGPSVVDAVDSYFGMRKIALGKDAKGITRLMLNGKFVFQVGPLDQGFWPDGLYTAPTDAALKYDIVATKGLGFNMIRKHVKVEPRRWYYWTDKLGMLVWQDMPSSNNRTPESKVNFEAELRRMVETHRNHPSIIMWVPLNEGWGQYDTERLTAMVEDLDPSRLVNNASGWTDAGAGHVRDVHTYPAPKPAPPEANRASVIGEFGGFGLFVPGHMWSEDFWGYQGLEDSQELARQYEKVFRQVWAQKDDPGISAVVYTQTTDVETEANGLLTYDRAQLKAPKARIVAANTGKLGPAPTFTTVVPSAQQEAVTWRYTTVEPAEGWQKPDFDDSAWKEGPAGFGQTGTNGSIVRTEWNTPDIWIRRTFTLPAGSTKDLALWIHHDENAQVYLNGVLAGRFRGFVTDYEDAPITLEARAALHAGENTIAIHGRNREGGQYIDAGIVRTR